VNDFSRFDDGFIYVSIDRILECSEILTFELTDKTIAVVIVLPNGLEVSKTVTCFNSDNFNVSKFREFAIRELSKYITQLEGYSFIGMKGDK